MAKYLLVRHGEPAWSQLDNRNVRGLGADLVQLTEQGVAQVNETCRSLCEYCPSMVLSSPMTRALQTGAIISNTLGLPLSVEYDLHEWLPHRSCDWDLPLVRASEAEFRANAGEWPAGQERDWETFSIIRARVTNVLQRYSDKGLVVVSCHAMVIESLTGIFPHFAQIVPFEQ